MRRHWAYLSYVLRHKWFVLQACQRTGASLWRGLLHDWSKFLPSEWFGYVRCFYKPDGTKQYIEAELTIPWWNHQRRNPHHWQFWLITWDRGETTPLVMPDKFVREMVADWIGAGRVIVGKTSDVKAWYEKSKGKMILHPDTRALVEQLLSELK